MRALKLSILTFTIGTIVALLAPGASALDINTDVTMPFAEVNHYYEFEFEGEEGCIQSYYTRYSSGTVPPGLEITRDLKIKGTPTTPGQYAFYVELADEGCPGISDPSQGQFFLTVLPELKIATEALPPAVPGVPYSVQLAHRGYEGGWDPPRWRIASGVLPPGLTLSSEGLLGGTPTAAGAWQVVIRVEEPFRRVDERAFTFVVAQPLQASALVPRPAEVGVPFTLPLAHTGGLGAVTWSATTPLPPGLSLDGATPTVRGTPRRAGTFAVTLQVRDETGSTATVDATLSVAPALRLLTRSVVVPRGKRVAAELRTRGGVSERLRWKAVEGRFPIGIRLNRRTGTLVGVTNKRGVYRVTIRARDALGAEATSRIVIRLR